MASMVWAKKVKGEPPFVVTENEISEITKRLKDISLFPKQRKKRGTRKPPSE